MSEVLQLDTRCWCHSRTGLEPDTQNLRLRLLEMHHGMAVVSCPDKVNKDLIHLIRVPLELVYGWV